MTLDRANAALRGRTELARLLDLDVPAAWPQPDFAQALPFIARELATDPTQARWTRLIVHRADRTVIGGIGSKGSPDASGAVEIGYDIIPSYRRQGYAVEAGAAFVGWLLAQPGVRRITAECLAGNTASIRVLEKLGLCLLERDGEMLRWELP